MMDLHTWACPSCHSLLAEEEDGVRCQREGRKFQRRNGILALMASEDEPLLLEAEHYAHAWARLGWLPSPEALRELPFVQAGPGRKVWKAKARAYESLMRILGPARTRRVGDMGAGTGWLAYRLASAGFRCYATDVSADARTGLGAASAYDATPGRFERVLATLTRWPFHDESLDVAICNASLHYVRNVRPVVQEARRVLRPEGVFVTMNEPVHMDARSAKRAAADFRERLRGLGGSGLLVEEYSHLVAEDYEATLSESFQTVKRHDPPYGPAFTWIRRAKGILLRMELASFPLYHALK